MWVALIYGRRCGQPKPEFAAVHGNWTQNLLVLRQTRLPHEFHLHISGLHCIDVALSNFSTSKRWVLWTWWTLWLPMDGCNYAHEMLRRNGLFYVCWNYIFRCGKPFIIFSCMSSLKYSSRRHTIRLIYHCMWRTNPDMNQSIVPHMRRKLLQHATTVAICFVQHVMLSKHRVQMRPASQASYLLHLYHHRISKVSHDYSDTTCRFSKPGK